VIGGLAEFARCIGLVGLGIRAQPKEPYSMFTMPLQVGYLLQP